MTASDRDRAHRSTPGAGWRLALRLIGPALLAVALYKLGSPERLFATLAHASPWLVGLALVLNAPVNHLKVVRWRNLLRARGHEYSLAKCWAAVLPSLYLGAVTPGRVGDVVRIQYFAHDTGAPWAEGLAVTVMDRLCDLYVLAVFVALGAARFAAVLHGELALATWSMVAFTVLAPAVLLVPGLAERAAGRVARRLARGGNGLERFLAALRALAGRALFGALPLSVGAFLTSYLQGWIVARALGLDLAFLDVLAMMAITSLLSLLPISLAGLGVRELFLAVLFPYLGKTVADGVAFGLLLFAVMFLVNVLAGFVAWQIRPPPVTARPSDRPS
jgi:uncharacterized protein (TIRG00374 family)